MTMEQEKTAGGGAHGPDESSERTTAAEYIKAARAHLKSGEQKQAYAVLLKALGFYPDHPIILSYSGWLKAVVDKKHLSGVASCRKAIVKFKTSDPDVAKTVYPFLYLNLGRTFLLAGKKKEAVDSFTKGLSYDRGHYDLKKEMKALGIRKKPILPILSRANPINKLAGKLIQAKNTNAKPR